MGHSTVGKGIPRQTIRRHVVCLALIFLACLVMFCAVGAAVLPGTQGVYRHLLIANEAKALTDPLQKDVQLRQRIYVQGPLYGVSLHFSTGGRVLQGNMRVELLTQPAGELLLSNETPLSRLQDNSFVDFPFNGVIDAGEGTSYYLQITAQPNTPQDAPRLYKSVDVPATYYYDENMQNHPPPYVNDFRLLWNGAGGPELLDLAYLTDVAGGFLQGPYFFFAAVLTALLLAAYVLLFMLGQPLHRVFVLCALGLGFVFLFLIPPRAAPDEYAHISTAYHYANQLRGEGAADSFAQNRVWMRPGDVVKLWNYDETSIGLFAYKDMAENLFTAVPEGPGSQALVRGYQLMPLQVAMPTLGVLLAQLLGLSRTGLFLLGRLFNLLFYTLVVSRAIRRMPFAKPVFFSVALLPMSLQLAASFSYDTYVLALSFYLLACCLDYRVNKKALRLRHILLLGLVCLLLAPAKSVYIPLLGLLFLIKPGQFATKAACVAARTLIIAASAALWLWYTAGSLALANGAAQLAQPAAAVQVQLGAGATVGRQHLGIQGQGNAGIQAATQPVEELLAVVPPTGGENGVHIEGYKGETTPSGDAVQLYDAGYILRNIPATLKIFARTVWEQGPLWLLGLVGGRLGESIAVDIQLSWVLVCALVLVLGLSLLPSGEDRRLLPTKHRLGFAAMALVCAGATVLASLTWTPVNYRTIFGIQGRYLLPVLPLLLLAARGGRLRFIKPRWRQLAFAQTVLMVLCQLAAFVTILGLGN